MVLNCLNILSCLLHKTSVSFSTSYLTRVYFMLDSVLLLLERGKELQLCSTFS